MPEQMIQSRVFPVLPPAELRAFCFYPMSKRRGDNTTGTPSPTKSASS
jgi:hypothetical protein